jgi:hypothetical protein
MKKELSDLEKIAYNCRKATLLIEKKQEEELTPREKMELKIHLAGCYICQVYEKQSVMINDMVRQLFKTPVDPKEVRLDDDFKKQLKEKLAKKMDKN